MSRTYILLFFFVLLSCKTSTSGYFRDAHYSTPRGHVITEVIDIKTEGIDEFKASLEIKNSSSRAYNDTVRAYNDSIIKLPKNHEKSIKLLMQEPPLLDFYYNQPTIIYNPTYSTGKDIFLRYISDSFRFPKIMIDNRIDGEAFVTFVVNVRGNVKSINFTNSLHPEADAEITRILLESKWNPATLNGKPKESTIKAKICFYLDYL